MWSLTRNSLFIQETKSLVIALACLLVLRLNEFVIIFCSRFSLLFVLFPRCWCSCFWFNPCIRLLASIFITKTRYFIVIKSKKLVGSFTAFFKSQIWRCYWWVFFDWNFSQAQSRTSKFVSGFLDFEYKFVKRAQFLEWESFTENRHFQLLCNTQQTVRIIICNSWGQVSFVGFSLFVADCEFLVFNFKFRTIEQFLFWSTIVHHHAYAFVFTMKYHLTLLVSSWCTWFDPHSWCFKMELCYFDWKVSHEVLLCSNVYDWNISKSHRVSNVLSPLNTNTLRYTDLTFQLNEVLQFPNFQYCDKFSSQTLKRLILIRIPFVFFSRYKYILTSRRSNGKLWEFGENRIVEWNELFSTFNPHFVSGISNTSSHTSIQTIFVLNDGMFRVTFFPFKFSDFCFFHSSFDCGNWHFQMFIIDQFGNPVAPSWRETGMLGITNTFASCSIISVVQTLFHIPLFRRVQTILFTIPQFFLSFFCDWKFLIFFD